MQMASDTLLSITDDMSHANALGSYSLRNKKSRRVKGKPYPF